MKKESGKMFRSLFSWNLLLMFRFHTSIYAYILVLISVFVELAFDVGLLPVLIVIPAVSIFVFVELALDDGRTEFEIYGEMEFQSLFSWNLLLMLIWVGRSRG